ncbi:MAG: condensation domain-containing protein, partial [Chlamydiales bacterium]|nr:condensation domain-containing protein [Chlamydiales bacterium]
MHKTVETSPHQQKMWFVDKFEDGYIYPHAPIYHNIPLLFRISGAFDLDHWQKTLYSVLSSHSIFTTKFESKNDVPFQCIGDALTFDYSARKMINATEANVLDELKRERNRPFAFEANFLVRACTISTSSESHYCQLVFHHAVCDRRTLSLVYRELITAYQQPSLLRASQALEFSQFSHWQNTIHAETEKKMVTYWRRKLTNSPPRLLLPTQKPRPLIHIYEDATECTVLGNDLSKTIQEHCQQLGVSTEAFFLTVYKFVLSKYTAQKEIV